MQQQIVQTQMLTKLCKVYRPDYGWIFGFLHMPIKSLREDKPKNIKLLVFDKFWTDFRDSRLYQIDISNSLLPAEVKSDVKLIEDFTDWIKLWLREEKNEKHSKENLECLLKLITYTHISERTKSQQAKLELAVPVRYNEIPDVAQFKVYNFLREKVFGLPTIPEDQYLKNSSKTLLMINTYGHE